MRPSSGLCCHFIWDIERQTKEGEPLTIFEMSGLIFLHNGDRRTNTGMHNTSTGSYVENTMTNQEIESHNS